MNQNKIFRVDVYPNDNISIYAIDTEVEKLNFMLFNMSKQTISGLKKTEYVEFGFMLEGKDYRLVYSKNTDCKLIKDDIHTIRYYDVETFLMEIVSLLQFKNPSRDKYAWEKDIEFTHTNMLEMQYRADFKDVIRLEDTPLGYQKGVYIMEKNDDDEDEDKVLSVISFDDFNLEHLSLRNDQYARCTVGLPEGYLPKGGICHITYDTTQACFSRYITDDETTMWESYTNLVEFYSVVEDLQTGYISLPIHKRTELTNMEANDYITFSKKKGAGTLEYKIPLHSIYVDYLELLFSKWERLEFNYRRFGTELTLYTGWTGAGGKNNGVTDFRYNNIKSFLEAIQVVLDVINSNRKKHSWEEEDMSSRPLKKLKFTTSNKHWEVKIDADKKEATIYAPVFDSTRSESHTRLYTAKVTVNLVDLEYNVIDSADIETDLIAEGVSEKLANAISLKAYQELTD